MVSDSQVIPLPTGERRALRPVARRRAMPSLGALFFTSVLTAVVTVAVLAFVSPATITTVKQWLPQFTAAGPTAEAVRTYTVQAGDTLSRIAQRELGDPTLWKVLYTHNRERMASPAELEVGTVLELPAR